MQYLGSKNRISKEIVPIIQSYITKNTKGYLEPFVGGANVIDKINCSNKIGSDIHEELIELLIKVQNTTVDLPNSISEEEYYKVKANQEKYPKWYVGLVGFCGSYGAKYFDGYAKGNDTRDRQNEAIRNLKNQSPYLKDIKFRCCDYREYTIDKIMNYVIYCDIPYRGTTKYKNNEFSYEDFYKWAEEMSKNNVVIISEYNMPEQFIKIWEKRTKVIFDCNRTAGSKENIRIEKLFMYNRTNGHIYN